MVVSMLTAAFREPAANRQLSLRAQAMSPATPGLLLVQ
jgi:hypothetical protein